MPQAPTQLHMPICHLPWAGRSEGDSEEQMELGLQGPDEEDLVCSLDNLKDQGFVDKTENPRCPVSEYP